MRFPTTPQFPLEGHSKPVIRSFRALVTSHAPRFDRTTVEVVRQDLNVEFVVDDATNLLECPVSKANRSLVGEAPPPLTEVASWPELREFGCVVEDPAAKPMVVVHSNRSQV